MKLSERVLITLLGFAFINVGQSAILDTVLDTLKEVTVGAQKIGNDIINGLVSPTAKCQHGVCEESEKLAALESRGISVPNYGTGVQNSPVYGVASQEVPSYGAAVQNVPAYGGSITISSENQHDPVVVKIV